MSSASAFSNLRTMLVPSILLTTAWSSLTSRDAHCNGPVLASAFNPPLPAPLHLHRAHGRSSHVNIRHGTTRAIDSQDGRLDTALFARNKNGGRKVPKMPTLPVTTSSSSSSSLSSPSSKDTNSDLHSTAEPNGGVSTVVVVDVENVRGAAAFRVSHEALLSRTRHWREDRLSVAASRAGEDGGTHHASAFLEPMMWVCDHGVTSSVHRFSPRSANGGDSGLGQEGAIRMPHNFGAMFAGPGRTADDVIVDLVGLRCGLHGSSHAIDGDDDEDPQQSATSLSTSDAASSRNTTIVITADAGLISRCQQARRQSRSLSDVIFVEPASLLQQLERYRTNSHEEEGLFGERSSATMTAPPLRSGGGSIAANGDKGGGKRSDGRTSKMTSFKESTIAMEQHAKFQARFQNGKKGSANTNETKGSRSGEKEEEKEDERELSPGRLDSDDRNLAADANGSKSAAAMEAQLKTEQIRRQLLLSDAYYLARPSKNVRGRRAHTTSAAVHAKYKNRNISKKQQKKLYQKRFGRKRKEDMVRAAVTRKELAARLQSNLERIDRSDGCEDVYGGDSEEDEDGTMVRSLRLLETLLAKFEEDRLLAGRGAHGGGNDGERRGTPSTIPGLPDGPAAPGRVGSDDRWDPLGSALVVPLPEDAGDGDDGDGRPLPPLRIVVISDTHGFEGGLARFADRSEEDPPSSSSSGDDGVGGTRSSISAHVHERHFLLPRADLLLHCGDFAASGSRRAQRLAARRLDEFLARQSHIPEKVVVKGNHDPESPAKVLFPNSKALYVRSSSTLTVNGVTFAVEPYSRRMAYRSVGRRTSSASPYAPSSLPECDVLVTHEPPKGVLDLTYHGFAAGSWHLREMVERAERKPRLWLCGHIHESRGVTTKHFRRPEVDGREDGERDATKTTMVINASNANSGRANRLVSGAVVVEVDRRPSSAAGGGDETAERTLRSRRVDEDYIDGLVEDPADSGSSSGGGGLAGLGEDLELYVTRPGVRRRKGLPQSMRQRLKRARSTLIASSDE